MGFVTLSYSLTDGTTAKGSEVRKNDDDIVAVVNGNITDSNIANTASIDCSKLSNIVGQQIQTDRIADNAINAAKLSSNASVDASRAVTTDHIRDNSITKGKLSLTAGLKITLQQLAITKVQQSWSYSMVDPYAGWVDAAVTSGESAGNYVFRISVMAYQKELNVNPPGSYIWKYVQVLQTLTPSTPIPVAGNTILSARLHNVSRVVNNIQGELHVVYISNT